MFFTFYIETQEKCREQLLLLVLTNLHWKGVQFAQSILSNIDEWLHKSLLLEHRLNIYKQELMLLFLSISTCSRSYLFLLRNKVAQTTSTTSFMFTFESSKIIELKTTTSEYIRISITSFASICLKQSLHFEGKLRTLRSNPSFIELLLISCFDHL